MKNEKDVKAEVKKILRKYGAYYFMPVPVAYSRTGVPDFLCCFHGRFFAIETKFGYNKPSPRQEIEMNDISAAGGDCLVINERNIMDVETYLQRWKNV